MRTSTERFVVDTELNYEERCQLSQMVMNILDDWQLSTDEQLALLGMPEDTRSRELTRLRHGSPYPEDNLLIDRARHLIGIHESLHVIFPHNRNMPAFWLRHRNRQFPNSPLSVMLDDGVSGMHRVWCYLDCTRNWED